MKVIFALCFSFLSLISYAQAIYTKVDFEKVSHQFGQIKEEGGPVSYNFKLTNTGTVPLIINNVIASCGCTTPTWSKDTILPGKTGFVKAQFDPYNRPGQFNKTLTVSSNAMPMVTVLSIQGVVLPRPKSAADQFPDKLGALRLQSRYLYLGEMTTEKEIVKEFDWYNDGNKNLTLESGTVPPFMKVLITPAELKPQEKGKIKLTYMPSVKNDYGYMHDALELMTNEVEDPKKTLIISSTIKPYITSEDPANAPKISFEKIVHDFGTIHQGDKASIGFVFKNIGKRDLVIFKTKATCGCTASEPEKKVLKAGESSVIQVIFDSAGKEGNQEKQINVYCNDPNQVNPVLTIKSFVKR